MMTTTDVQSQQNPATTDVIIVVKGAGIQKADATLDVFLNGFWPAVQSLYPNATMSQRDVTSSADSKSSQRVTEIIANGRPLWVKESYWETSLIPAGSLTVLAREWRMATFTFGDTICKWVMSIPQRAQKTSSATPYPSWAYLLSFLIVYWTLIAAPLWVTLQTYLPTNDTLGNIWFVARVAFALALVVAIPPSLRAWRVGRTRVETNNRIRTRRRNPVLPDNSNPDDQPQKITDILPGIANWLLLFLIAAFLLNPIQYLVLLVFLAMAELALLWVRALVWRYRPSADSDSGEWKPIHESDSRSQPGDKRTSFFFIRFSVILYRYIVVIGLPITFLGLTITRLLKWSRIFGSAGESIEQFLSLVLSSVLGDVVTYAMDPAQAHRVRSAVESDIEFFHDCQDVKNIHIFAHSQGTAITFEVLFHHLPAKYRTKVKTYMTIGSVLSYYNQAMPILDPIPTQRFSKVAYLTKSDPPFPDEFKWINFWNLIDPITEFYGLDEYVYIDQGKRDDCSPINIKTKATSQNHSEYWSNQEQVHRPLVKRVFGQGDLPSEWKNQSGQKFGLRLPSGISKAVRNLGKSTQNNSEDETINIPHQLLVFLLTAVIWIGLWCIFQQSWLFKWVGQLGLTAWSTLMQELPALFPEIFKNLASWQTAINQIDWNKLHRAGTLATLIMVAILLSINAVTHFGYESLYEVQRRWKARRIHR